MLPFLKNKIKNNPGLIVQERAPDADKAAEDRDDPAAAIEACAQDLIDAVHAKDVKAAASAIQAAFEILDSMPHEEGEHTNEDNSFAGRNIAAAKERND